MRNQNTMMIVIGLIIVVIIGVFVVKKVMKRRNASMRTEFAVPNDASMPEVVPAENDVVAE